MESSEVEKSIGILLDKVIGIGVFNPDQREEILDTITGKLEKLSWVISVEQADFLQALNLDYYVMINKTEHGK